MDLPSNSESPDRNRSPRYLIETKSLSYSLPSKPKTLTLQCHDINVLKKPVLKNIDCELLPGELLAIVGPSGAGKTTLLSVFAGSIDPGKVSGEILVNCRKMNVSKFRRISGFVTQDDALFPLLTVEESLTYSAKLRLRASSTEAAARVLELIKQLGLDHVAASRIGGDGSGGISGGERRRVSIGVELVHDPAVLLLDEPTSGLDSASALNIIKMLKNMAVIEGKTVVLTIHQPGFRILELFDKILLLSNGEVKHHGTIQKLESRLNDAGHCIPPHVNVLEFAMEYVSTLVMESVVSNPGEQEVVPVQNPSSAAKEDRILFANSRYKEVCILGTRFFRNISRSKDLFISKMLQCIVAGLALGTIFINVTNLQARLGFFAFSLTFLLTSTSEGLPIFLQERRILSRETSRGAYRVSSYVIANAVVFMPFLLASAFLYSIPVYWLIGLGKEIDKFFYFSLIVWLVMLMANSFVACFSALVPNFIMGNSIIAGIMGSFFLFSGYFISKDNIPKYWIMMHYLSFFKYPFEAFMINEYGGNARYKCLKETEGSCEINGEMFLQQQGVKEAQKWRNVGVMFAFICGYRILCFFILWFRCNKVRR